MKDLFSKQSTLYARYRPSYPKEVFSFLLSNVLNRERVWDCGTGNGQVAGALAEFFTRVDATDISENQIRNAVQRENIFYAIEPAEKTSFPPASFDMITVAQAIHWFHFDKFYAEVSRTLKPGGIVAVIGYPLPMIDPVTDALVLEFYEKTLAGFWDPERRYLDEDYKTIPFPFKEISTPQFYSTQYWSNETLFGYLRSWSAVQHFETARSSNPVDAFAPLIQLHWRDGIEKEVRFRILLRVGKL